MVNLQNISLKIVKYKIHSRVRFKVTFDGFSPLLESNCIVILESHRDKDERLKLIPTPECLNHSHTVRYTQFKNTDLNSSCIDTSCLGHAVLHNFPF